MHCTDATYCYMSHFTWSACIGHTYEPCKNGWTDQDNVFGVGDSCGPENYDLDAWGTHWCYQANMIEQSMHRGLMSNYFEHLFAITARLISYQLWWAKNWLNFKSSIAMCIYNTLSKYLYHTHIALLNTHLVNCSPPVPPQKLAATSLTQFLNNLYTTTLGP